MILTQSCGVRRTGFKNVSPNPLSFTPQGMDALVPKNKESLKRQGKLTKKYSLSLGKWSWGVDKNFLWFTLQYTN
jgi:hypothetical protein